MSRKFTISETDIYNLILEEFNDNAFSSKIKFSYADWSLVDSNGVQKGLLINKLALNSEGRFDVQETFDENTYAKTTNSFVAMNIGPLNGEFTALNKIKDVVYDTVVEFLVCIDNFAVQQAITLSIAEVRARFIQYERVVKVSYMDIEDISSGVRIEENLKAIFMSGSIDYGTITQINGKQYLTYSLPITIEITNFGEFANQQKIYLGVDKVNFGALYNLEPNEWSYGVLKGVESAMLLPSKATGLQSNATEIKSVPKNKGFSLTIEHQMDLKDSELGELLYFIYKRSLIPTISHDIYTAKIETYLYDEESGEFKLEEDLTMERQMELIANQPNESLSKGEKIVYTLVFVPYYESI